MLKYVIDYLVNNYNLQPNVAVTIILSLFTFSLGFIITWTAAAVNRWIKKRNYRKSLKVIIKSFLDSCKSQAILLEESATQKGFLYGEDFQVFIKSNFGQNYLSNLDIKTFIENFSSLLSKSRPQEISDFFEIVETLRSTKETFKEQMKIYYSSYEENLKKYNENLDSLRKLQDDLALEYNGKTIERSLGNYIHSIGDTFSSWTKKGADIKIYSTYTDIVNPLFSSALTIPPNPISRKVIDFGMQCRIAFESISGIEKRMREEAESLKTIHLNSYSDGIKIFNGW